jgi:hypothetical protein
MSHYYDNSDAVWALVSCGEDAFGPWVAGTVKPGITDERLVEVRSCGLSGDWRKLGGHLELVAALSVPTGGFPVTRIALAASAEEEPLALVAAGGRAVLEAARHRRPPAGFDPREVESAVQRALSTHLRRTAAREAIAPVRSRVTEELAARRERARTALGG